MKRILTILAGIALSALMSASVFAQGNYEVKGSVSDILGPVVGATVVEQGTSNGAVTDANGNWSLKVASADAIVEISCIGYKTVSFKASAVPASLVLEDDNQFLEEVVVIGYGTVRKGDMTGSVSAVKADQLNKGVAVSPSQMLIGKSAGVVVTQGDGAPGSGSTIRIRGGSSLKANNDPLIVVDGLPLSEVGISGVSDGLASINPSDIETFTVLKDASATAIYGSRASNGVIIITTKKGSKIDNKLHVSADVLGSLSQNSKYVDVLDGPAIRSLMEELYGKDSSAYALLTPEDKNKSTDWQKEIYQLAKTFEANASLSGNVGNKRNYMPWRVSLGYHNQEGTLKTSALSRETINVNLNPMLLDEHLSINVNAKGTNMNTRFANQDAIGAAVRYDPTKPVYDEKGLNGYTWWNYGNGTATVGNCNTMAGQNPVALLNDKKDLSHAMRIITNAQIDYKIHGLEDLRLNLNLGLDTSKSDGTVDVAPDTEQSMHTTAQQQSDGHASGYHTNYSQVKTDQTLEAYIDYSHTFAGKHFLDAMAGYSWSHYYYETFNETLKANDLKTYLSKPNTFKTEYFLVSFFGRLNYSYDNRYLLTATIRRDGTSRFANNKWGLFPSVAASWNIKNESFLKDSKALSALKLRLSWGQTGQQDLQSGNYPTLATYVYNTDACMYPFGASFVTPITAKGYNADLKWETTTTWNIGLDYGFIGGRLYGAIDLYKRFTKDLLNYTPVAAGANLSNYLNANIGDLENQGVEFEINAVPVETKDWSWTLGFNATWNKTLVTRLTSDDKRAKYYGVETGGISGGTGNTIQVHQTGHAPNSFFVYQQVYDTDGKPIEGAYVDRNADGVIDTDDKYCFGKAAPDWTFGFNTQLSYRKWTLALSAHANVGNYVYDNISSNGDLLTDLSTNSFVNNRVTSAAKHNFANYAQYWSDMYVTDASFLKFDNLTLSRNFDFGPESTPMRLSAYFTVQNLATITGYKGIDPEIFSGIDNNMYPRPRTFILGVKYNF